MTPETLESVAKAMFPEYKWSFYISLDEPEAIHGYATVPRFRGHGLRVAYAHRKVYPGYHSAYYAHMIEEMKVTLDEQVEKMGLVGWKERK